MIRSAYNFDADSFSLLNGTPNDEDSMTHQSFKDECDINVILRRFAVTGEMPSGVRVPQYGEFEESFDFMSAMNVIRDAQEAFAAMPSDVRERFANDPARFVDFVNNEDNYDEAVKMGIAIKRPVSEPTPTPAPSAPVSTPSAPVPAAPSTSAT